MVALTVERTGILDVDGTGDAAFQCIGARALRHIDAIEQAGREHVQVDLAVRRALAGKAEIGRHGDAVAVHADQGEAGRQGAHRNLRTVAGQGIALHHHAGDALHRFRQIQVRKLADIFREDGFAEIGRILLGLGGTLQRSAKAGDDHDRGVVGRSSGSGVLGKSDCGAEGGQARQQGRAQQREFQVMAALRL